MSEANEPPLETAKREVREELGIEYGGGRLLVVDWMAPHGPWDDILVFLFDGGVFTERQKEEISVDGNELAAFRFLEPPDSAGMLRPHVLRRVQNALNAQRCLCTEYLHDGDKPHPTA